MLLVRAEGGPGIGYGHLGRCLALVQAWRDSGGEAGLMADGVPPHWVDRYRAEGAIIIDGAAWPELTANDWVVLDGYSFGLAEHRDIKGRGARLAVIDDHGSAGSYGADVVVDQNLGARPDLYANTPGDAVVLLGPRYALLRREFLEPEDRRAVVAVARRLLVALGGSPPAGVRALVDAALGDDGVAPFDLLVLENRTDVAAEMASADFALAAAGSTCWELCRLALPALLLSTAPNQRPVAAAMADAGAGVDLGWYEDVTAAELVEALNRLAQDPGERQRMADTGPGLVDGFGALRVTAELRARLVTLRDAGPDDAELVWQWANDARVRRSAFSSASIPWSDHIVWFSERLRDPDSQIYIALDTDGRPVGQVRFHTSGAAAEIDISVAEHARGKGWGPAIVVAGVRRLRHGRGPLEVRAAIKPDNRASLRTFQAAGFYALPTMIDSPDRVHYVSRTPE